MKERGGEKEVGGKGERERRAAGWMVQFGCLDPFCPEDRTGTSSGVRVWVSLEETHAAGPWSFCGW